MQYDFAYAPTLSSPQICKVSKFFRSQSKANLLESRPNKKLPRIEFAVLGF